MILLNGKKYLTQTEVVKFLDDEISNVFNQYNEHTSPWPPVHGIKQITEYELEIINQVKKELLILLKDSYVQHSEKYKKISQISSLYESNKISKNEYVSYSEYIKNKNNIEVIGKFKLFIKNVCISIILEKLLTY